VQVFNKFVTDLEAQLQQTEWMAGGSYSLAEIGYTPYLIRLDELQLWSWMDDKPHVTELYERIKARPNFNAGYLDWRNDTYCALMAEKGAEAWPRIKEVLDAD
jgi:glutathione S-transferase